MNRMKTLLLLLFLPVLHACGAMDLASRGSDAATTGPLVYYVATPDLRLYPEPSSSHKPLDRLPLNEKLMRYKVQQGYAYVRVERTGQMGWVNNGHLSWKMVAVHEERSEEAIEQEAVPAVMETKSEPPPQKITHPSRPNPKVEGRDASIFDAF